MESSDVVEQQGNKKRNIPIPNGNISVLIPVNYFSVSDTGTRAGWIRNCNLPDGYNDLFSIYC